MSKSTKKKKNKQINDYRKTVNNTETTIIHTSETRYAMSKMFCSPDPKDVPLPKFS